MKSEELRIGNWVSFNDLYCKIVGIDKDRVLIEYYNGETDYRHTDYIEPIELTEEVLVKIGFEKFVKSFRMELSGCRLDYFIDKTLYIYKKHTNCCLVKDLEIKCEYAHQLQNAYSLLTNEELKIEL